MDISSFSLWEKYTNAEVADGFSCAPQGGMRKSNKNNCLVLIVNHTKGLYDDQWQNDRVIHYTGMGMTGDQKLSGQNSTLADSNTNGVTVHLFEVFHANEYIYCGTATLVDEFFWSEQLDSDNVVRNVIMFPLELDVKEIPNDIIELRSIAKGNTFERGIKKVKKLNYDELARLAHKRSEINRFTLRETTTKVYGRDPVIATFTKQRAKGVCELCGEDAPFKDKQGEPYLECHHIVWLSRGGEDTIENTVALCPNCHRRVHVLEIDLDIKMLIGLIEE
ncbi:HNH endonuclease [Culicoidibacter larvae]|uniref:HNH endonuclease n=1 Tax=Culicoidibacter larvae TaxID=2579976 RepID=A0A5R8QH88_9FIRM|nr:HNH endonuclease [Culicoidibacter larvae]TLG77395.1 HNH endonuclease [Culicoidibacter larvae]